MHMEVGAHCGRFVGRGINIYDVTIHPSQGSRINPTLKVCEYNWAAYISQVNSFRHGRGKILLVESETSSFKKVRYSCGSIELKMEDLRLLESRHVQNLTQF